jgi:hypothetical protein
MVREPIDAMVIRHLRGTLAASRPVVTAEPVRVICAWCKDVMVDVPEDERGVSHGICAACFATEGAPLR